MQQLAFWLQLTYTIKMKIQDKKIILHALKFTHCLKINKVIEVKNEKKEVNQYQRRIIIGLTD